MLFVLFWFLAKSHFSSFYLASVFYSTFFDFGYSFSLLLLLFVFTFSSLIIRVHLPPFLLNDKKFFFLQRKFLRVALRQKFFCQFFTLRFLVFSCCLYLPFLLLLFASTFHLFSSSTFHLNESFYTSHYVKKFFKTLFSQLKKNKFF